MNLTRSKSTVISPDEIERSPIFQRLGLGRKLICSSTEYFFSEAIVHFVFTVKSSFWQIDNLFMLQSNLESTFLNMEKNVGATTDLNSVSSPLVFRLVYYLLNLHQF